MQKETMRMAAMICGLMTVLLCGVMASPAHAQVHINVNIGPPPPVIVEAPPPMLFLPEPGIYVAAGTPYDIFFIGGRYYYFYEDEDTWFWGPGYGGPWTYVTYRTLPPGLRKYKVKQLREYREREYRVYRVEGRNFNGKHFYAEGGPGEKERDHDNGKHKGWKH